MGRRHVPRVLLSDGTEPEAVAGPPPRADGALVGIAAPAGTVTGPARVVLDPTDAHLLPGEVLVAPSTDPGWTPLFLTAGGLVMEMGGANSHGAVVAREYGIPAVVGVPARRAASARASRSPSTGRAAWSLPPRSRTTGPTAVGDAVSPAGWRCRLPAAPDMPRRGTSWGFDRNGEAVGPPRRPAGATARGSDPDPVLGSGVMPHFDVVVLGAGPGGTSRPSARPAREERRGRRGEVLGRGVPQRRLHPVQGAAAQRRARPHLHARGQDLRHHRGRHLRLRRRLRPQPRRSPTAGSRACTS